MKKIGDVTNTADKNGEFTNGNIATGTPPTILEGPWLTAIQREILNVLVKAGVVQDPNKDNQLAASIEKIAKSSVPKLVQETGDEENAIMSQKAVTDAISESQVNVPDATTTVKGKVKLTNDRGDSEDLSMTQKGATVLYDSVIEMMSNNDGFSKIGACNSIGELKEITPPNHNDRVIVNKYHADEVSINPREYVWDSLSIDSDNGGTIIKSLMAENGRWKLQDVGGSIDARFFGIKPTQIYADTDVNYSQNLINAMSAIGGNGILHFSLPTGWNEAHYLVHAVTDWSQCYISADAGVILHAANTNDDDNKKPRLKSDVVFSQKVPNNPIDYGTERGSNNYDVKSAISSAVASAVSTANFKTVPIDFTKAASAIRYSNLNSGSSIAYAYDSTGTVIAKDQITFDSTTTSSYCGVSLVVSVGTEIEMLVENTGLVSAGTIIAGFKALSTNGTASTTLAMHINVGNNNISLKNGNTVVANKAVPFLTDMINANTDNAIRVGVRVISQNVVAFILNGRVMGTISTSSVFAREAIFLVDDVARTGIRFKYAFYRVRDKINYTVPLKIACLGDSITRGARTSNEWPSLISAYAESLPGIGRIKQLTNFGVSGRTLRGFVADINSLDFKGFDFTLIQLGTNDCQNKGNTSQFYNDIITLGNKVVADGSVPVFAVFPKFTTSEITGNGNRTNNAEYIAKYQALVRAAAESKSWKVVFVDDFFGDNCGQVGDYDNTLKISNSWCHDNIHPNSRGSIAIASAFASALTSLLSYPSCHSITEKLTVSADVQSINELSHGVPAATLSGNTVSLTGCVTTAKNNLVIAKLPAFAVPTRSIFVPCTFGKQNTWYQARVEIRPNGDIAIGSDYVVDGTLELSITYNI